jgi:carbamoyl-phosphate synthase large subunit
MAGKTLKELGITSEVDPKHMAVKESVFPFVKFPGVDTILGPEMKSTGEVMGIDDNFAMAFAKAQLGAGVNLPMSGKVFFSVRDCDKKHIVDAAKNCMITALNWWLPRYPSVFRRNCRFRW